MGLDWEAKFLWERLKLWDSFLKTSRDFPGGSDGESVCLQHGRPGFNSWVENIPWRRKWQATPVFLPGKSHG